MIICTLCIIVLWAYITCTSLKINRYIHSSYRTLTGVHKMHGRVRIPHDHLHAHALIPQPTVCLWKLCLLGDYNQMDVRTCTCSKYLYILLLCIMCIVYSCTQCMASSLGPPSFEIIFLHLTLKSWQGLGMRLHHVHVYIAKIVLHIIIDLWYHCSPNSLRMT